MSQSVFAKVSALAADLARIGIGKTETNESQRFKYRGIDQTLDVLGKLIPKHGLILIPSVVESARSQSTTSRGSVMFTTVTRVRYTFIATDDGSQVSFDYLGEGSDTGDKSTSKSLTMALKYALFHALQVPLSGDSDADASTPEEVVQSTEPSPVFDLDSAVQTISSAASVEELNAAYTAAAAAAKSAGREEAIPELVAAGKKAKSKLTRKAA